MSPAAAPLLWLLAVVLASVASAVAGVVWGVDQGRARQAALHDRAAVVELTALVASHKALVDQASTASRAMRQATAARTAADARTSQEFADALASSAASRAGCQFPAGVMRQLADARDRAAQAAAGGLHGAVPSPGASAAGQR